MDSGSLGEILLLLDLCSGKKGVSSIFKKRGWDVISVDINPDFEPDIVADIINWQYDGKTPDLIWGSPDCTQFCKASLPMSWASNRKNPPNIDMRLLLNVYRIIREQNPRYWVIENVQGARGYFNLVLGHWRSKVGSRYLWGEFPLFDTRDNAFGKWKLPPSEDRPAIRSLIPPGITLALENAIRCEMAAS